MDYSGEPLTCSLNVRRAVLDVLSGIRVYYVNSPSEYYNVYGVGVYPHLLGAQTVLYVVRRDNHPIESFVIGTSEPIVCVQFVKEYENQLPVYNDYINWSKARRIKYVLKDTQQGLSDFTGPEGTTLRLYNDPKKQGNEQYPDIVYLPQMIEAPKSVLRLCH